MQETWKQIKDFPKYEVSDLGNVRNFKTKRVLRPYISNTGYKMVCLRKDNKQRTVTLHRLVLKTFDPLEDDSIYLVNHKDWNKTNNKLENLEWVTHSQNILYGGTQTQLKILQAMIHNELKQLLVKFFDEIKDIKVTKEAFTKEVIDNAFELAIKNTSNKNIEYRHANP